MGHYMIYTLSIFIGMLLAPIAAIISFLITYEEYQRHFPDSRIPRKMALQTALYTFIIFLAISIFVGIVMASIFQK